MLRFYKSLLALFFIFAGVNELYSQKKCETTTIPNYLLREITNNNTTSTPTYTIPVVFHIYYDENGATPPAGYTDIQKALDTLNMRFQKRNWDTTLVYSGFRSIIGNAGIEFVLAKKDELGNCISGIDYHYVQNQSIFTVAVPNYNTNKYLNIHVMNHATGFAGTGSYPTPWSTTPAANNQITIIGDGLLGTVLTHEAGHWLSLIHTFGNVNQTGTCGDDMVSDTPVTSGGASCDTLQSVCNFPVVENINNYMDYSPCLYMFTQGQVSRMLGTLNDTTLSRRDIWKASNLAFTGVNPAASCPTFSMSIVSQLNQYDACTFSPAIDFAANPHTTLPDSVKWIFPFGTPGTSTSASQRVVFSVSTPVTITLKAYHSGILDTYTTSVTPSGFTTTGLNLKLNYPFAQNFENGFSLPSSDLYVIPGDTVWKIKNVGYNSDSCLFVPKENKLQTDTNKFVSGVFNFTQTSHPMLNFKVATSKNSNIIYRKLFVYLKNRCSNTERLVTIQYDSVMAVNNTSPGFTPSSAGDWKNVFVNLGFTSSDSARKEYEFRFELVKYFKPGKVDENFYLDDINIIDSTSGLPPVANFSIENVHFCSSGCYQLEIVDQSAGNPFYYAWGGLAPSNPVLKGCYTNIASGDTSYIYLQVTNQYGTSSITKPIYIHHIYVDSLTVSPTTVCQFDTINMHFYGTNYIENAETYKWTNANTPSTPHATLLDTTGNIVRAVPTTNVTYNIAVKNAYGCSASFTKNITVLSLPFMTTSSSKSCIGNGDSTVLSSYYNANYSYQWLPQNGIVDPTLSSVTATPSVTTNYSLTVTDNFGCHLTQSVPVKVSTLFPVVNIVASDTFPCGSQTVNFTANGNQNLTYNWSENPCCMGTFTPSGNTASGTFFTTETISVTGTDSNGCVSAAASLVIPFNNTPPDFWVSPFTQNVNGGMQINLCNLPPNDSVCMIASGLGSYTYTWTSVTPANGFFSSVQNNIATYHATSMNQIIVTAADANGCTASHNYFVNRSISNIAPPFTFSPTSVSICANTTQLVSLNPTNSNYYYWMPTSGLSGIIPIGNTQNNFGNGNSATITGINSMNYTVTAMDYNSGCVGSKTLSLNVKPAPLVNLGADTTICNGAVYVLNAQNAGATYNWSTGAGTQTISVSVANTYSVVVTASNGCAASDVMVLSTHVCTGIEAMQMNNDFIVSYSDESISIKEVNSNPFSIKMYDLTGRVILSEKSNGALFLLNENDLSAGIYLLKLEMNGNERVVKIVIH